MTDESIDKNKPLKSYVIRASRLTEAQKKAIDSLWNLYVIPFSGDPLDLVAAFQNKAPLTVEIGFGMGDSLLELAIAQPNNNFLGIEVHKPGVGKILHGIHTHQLNNIKIVCDDASEVISQGLSNGVIDKLLIYFPDPWHKKRHNKRRLIQLGFMELIKEKLKLGAQVHLATDWEHYAEHMLEVMENAPGYRNKIASGKAWENPERPQTKFERRGLRLGHGVWDYLYERES